MTRARWILVYDRDGVLVPARTDDLGNARTFRTERHASDLAEKINADLNAGTVTDDFGEGARP